LAFLTSREGEEGDNLYVIQSGVFEAVKGSGDDEKLLFKYEEAGAFGELALMYNCRRAATVRVSHLLLNCASCVGCSKGLCLMYLSWLSWTLLHDGGSKPFEEHMDH